MRFMSRSSVRACPLALVLATLPVVAQVVPSTQPTTEPAPVPATVSTTQPMAVERPAMQPATSPSATTVPIAIAGGPSVVAPTQTTRPYDPNAKTTFNFRDASIDSVLDYLSESLGFIIIKDERISTRVTLASRQAVSATEAVDLLNSVLKPLNYTAIQTGRVLRVTTRDKAKKINIPVRFGADPAQVRISDEMITQVIPLGGVDAVKLRTDLQPLFSPDADVTANAGSNTIIITDSSANIHRIVEVISAMDHQTASTSAVKIFQLQYASASNAAKLINDLFKQDQQPGQQQGGGRGGFPGFPFGRFGGGPGGQGGAQASTGGSDNGRTSGKVTASSDDRTNTLVVSGPAAVLEVVADIVKTLDANPAQQSSVFVFHLRNGQADRMAATINTMFGTGGSSSVTSSVNSLTRSPYVGTGSSSSTMSRSSSSNAGRNTLSTGGTTGGRMGFGGFGFGGFGSSTSSNTKTAVSDMQGQVYVVADTDTNSLIVTTAPAYKERVETILRELDRSAPQVLIKVLLAEVTHSDNTDFGIQSSYAYKAGNGNSATVGTDYGLTQPSNGLTASYVEGNFSAALRALQTEGKLDVLSRPYILASDNQLASILVGQEVPFITDTRVTDTGQTINTIQYQDIGIMLDVVPHINPDGKVIMDVAPEISAIQADTTVKISDTVNATVFSKRSAQSRIAVNNGQTVVIGGLMEDKKDMTVQKVPLLGDIPVLGNLFKHTVDDKRKTELLIFLTPHVITEAGALTPQSQDEVNGVKIVPNAIAPGTFDEHLKGMTRGATTAPVEPLHAPSPVPSKSGVK